jgi:hypothetical protein
MKVKHNVVSFGADSILPRHASELRTNMDIASYMIGNSFF